MSSEQTVAVAYGLFLFLGGFMGARAGSRVSLWAGLGSGLAALVFSAWMSTQPASGVMGMRLLTAALSLIFAQRLAKTRRFMPSGLLIAVSLVLFVYYCGV